MGACKDAKRRIFDLAAKRLKVNPESLELKGGQIYIKGRTDAAIKLSDLFVPGGGGVALTGELIGESAYMGRELASEERERMIRTHAANLRAAIVEASRAFTSA